MATGRAGTHCAASFACIIPSNPYNHPDRCGPVLHRQKVRRRVVQSLFPGLHSQEEAELGWRSSLLCTPASAFTQAGQSLGQHGVCTLHGAGRFASQFQAVSLAPSIYLLQPPRCGLPGHSPRSCSPFPPSMLGPPPPPARAEPALLLLANHPCTNHPCTAGSQSAVKAASAGQGEGASLGGEAGGASCQ